MGKQNMANNGICAGFVIVQKLKILKVSVMNLDLISRLFNSKITARVLGISPATVIRKILKVASKIDVPEIPRKLGRTQVEEVHTFIQNKKREIYIIYSWDQELKRAMSFVVGTRSRVNLRSVVNPLLSSEIESVNTDGYSGYKGVVPKKLHTTFKRRNNGIERQNLNLRTHLKRLNRRTICFSKSKEMLEAVLKIYFWYESSKNTV